MNILLKMNVLVWLGLKRILLCNVIVMLIANLFFVSNVYSASFPPDSFDPQQFLRDLREQQRAREEEGRKVDATIEESRKGVAVHEEFVKDLAQRKEDYARMNAEMLEKYWQLKGEHVELLQKYLNLLNKGRQAPEKKATAEAEVSTEELATTDVGVSTEGLSDEREEELRVGEESVRRREHELEGKRHELEEERRKLEDNKKVFHDEVDNQVESEFKHLEAERELSRKFLDLYLREGQRAKEQTYETFAWLGDLFVKTDIGITRRNTTTKGLKIAGKRILVTRGILHEVDLVNINFLNKAIIYSSLFETVIKKFKHHNLFFQSLVKPVEDLICRQVSGESLEIFNNRANFSFEEEESELAKISEILRKKKQPHPESLSAEEKDYLGLSVSATIREADLSSKVDDKLEAVCRSVTRKINSMIGLCELTNRALGTSIRGSEDASLSVSIRKKISSIDNMINIFKSLEQKYFKDSSPSPARRR